MRGKTCKTCGTINAGMAVDCKDCGAPLGNLKKESGGSDGRCAWEDFGQRCRARGIFSEATNGEGPWYCRRHERMRLGRGDPGNVHVETSEERYSRLMAGRTFPELDRRGLVARIASQMTSDLPPKPQQIGDEVPW